MIPRSILFGPILTRFQPVCTVHMTEILRNPKHVSSFTVVWLYCTFQPNQIKIARVILLFSGFGPILACFWPVRPVKMTRILRNRLCVSNFTWISLHTKFKSHRIKIASVITLLSMFRPNLTSFWPVFGQFYQYTWTEQDESFTYISYCPHGSPYQISSKLDNNCWIYPTFSIFALVLNCLKLS